MSKPQKALLVLMALNLLVILAFPPFDDYSVTNNDIAIFGGFRFILGQAQHAAINASLLYLEVAVVLVNTGILWMLTAEGGSKRDIRHRFGFRKATLVLIVVNLVGIMLFPPFEYISNMTRATIPSFEGFYFIFSAPPYRVIVTPILYLEVMFVLVNAGLLLLAFKERGTEMMNAEQTVAFMANMP